MAAAVEVQEQKKVSVEGQSVSSPDILLLDGLGMAGDWYGESLVGKGSVFTGVSANDSVAARWAKWVIEGCRCRLSSGCSTKSLWCLGIPSGNQQKPSRRE